jgi:hypothetical protein
MNHTTRSCFSGHLLDVGEGIACKLRATPLPLIAERHWVPPRSRGLKGAVPTHTATVPRFPASGGVECVQYATNV